MYAIQTGATSKSFDLEAFDATTNAPATGVAFGDVTFDWDYAGADDLTGKTDVAAITLAAQTTAFAEKGFRNKYANTYRFDAPDACFAGAAGLNGTIKLLASGIYFEPIRYAITGFNPVVAPDVLGAIVTQTTKLLNPADSDVVIAQKAQAVQNALTLVGKYGHKYIRNTTTHKLSMTDTDGTTPLSNEDYTDAVGAPPIGSVG